MTSNSEGQLDLGRMRRLHPWSWLFVLLAQLRQFALPLIVLLLFGRGGDWQEIAAAVSALGLSLVAIWRYFTYRYLVDAQELVIRSGLILREVRHLPFQRIHNIELSRNPVHRLFGVAEVRIESATGGKSAEARMQVLALHDARDLLERVRSAQQTAPLAAVEVEAEPASSADVPEAPATGSVLLQVPLRHLVWLGLVSQQGWVVFGVAAGAWWQLQPRDGWRAIPNLVELWFDFARAWLPGVGWAVAALLLTLLVFALVRVFGMALEIIRHYGFVLTEHDERLSFEGGLLTRVQHHVRRPKVQRWIERRPWLLAWRGLAALQVETAASSGEQDDPSRRSALLPVAPQATVAALRARWIPELNSRDEDWQPIHPRAWRRLLKWPVALYSLGIALLCATVGIEAAPLFAPVLLIYLSVRRDAGFRGWHCDAAGVRWRHGAWSRQCELIPIDRIQGLRLSQSPFDRRAGMAHLQIDTAGIRDSVEATTLSYLDADVARALRDRLAHWIEAAASLAPERGAQQEPQRAPLEPAEPQAPSAGSDRERADSAVALADPFSAPAGHAG